MVGFGASFLTIKGPPNNVREVSCLTPKALDVLCGSSYVHLKKYLSFLSPDLLRQRQKSAFNILFGL